MPQTELITDKLPNLNRNWGLGVLLYAVGRGTSHHRRRCFCEYRRACRRYEWT
jgi:hypothetical protein